MFYLQVWKIFFYSACTVKEWFELWSGKHEISHKMIILSHLLTLGSVQTCFFFLWKMKGWTLKNLIASLFLIYPYFFEVFWDHVSVKNRLKCKTYDFRNMVHKSHGSLLYNFYSCTSIIWTAWWFFRISRQKIMWSVFAATWRWINVAFFIFLSLNHS